jgi:hypothetical protein
MSPRTTPRELAAAVRDLAPGLTARPWSRHDPDETLWWLVPSTEWPAYSHGKLVFSTDRAPAGEIFAGLNVEKGFGVAAIQAYPKTPRTQVLGPGWTWHLVVDGEGPTHFAKVLGEVSIRQPALVRVEASRVSDPSDYDPHGVRRQRESLVFRCSPDGLSLAQEVQIEVLSPLTAIKSFVRLAERLRSLPEADWLWVDLYAGVTVRRDTALDVTDLYRSVLSRLAPWVR